MRQDIHNSNVPSICRECEARHNGICGALNEEELQQIAKHTRQVVHAEGDELMSESEPVEYYANVMRGAIKLSKMLADGRQQVVGLQFAPDFLGRPFARESRLTAEAASETKLCHIPKPAFEAMLKQNAQLEHRLFDQTLRELDEARDWMLTLGRKTASEKLASFLLLIATHINPVRDENSNRAVFDLPLTRADIADFLGLTIETVSRQLTKLRSAGVIEVTNNRHVVIPDLERLSARCG
ncbi:MAG: helix-turn-helix domain-containing protein [Gammaproteobacteria bacterium]|nr:helix-turn-helix domain-containing protein [Gammaproteobacteria bacterium]